MSRSRVIPPATYVRWALVVAAGAVGARHLYRDAAALRTVAPDLRTPIMFLPVAPGGPRHLKAMRRMSNVEFPVARGVSIASTNVPSADGRPIRIVTYQRSERTRPSAALVWSTASSSALAT